ncbi:MAG: acyl transferase domain-containing protein/acyl carrier protein [Arenicella sp.]|jgi:acyl transferase domain-containing protein/acyl carrier protein
MTDEYTMTDKNLSSAIAIVGMACRLPGAGDLNAFWSNLKSGRESVRQSSEQELSESSVPEHILSSPDFRSSCGRLDGIESFDAEFFDINPALAEVTSPQQRLLLEVSYHALEDAAYVPSCYNGRIGIHAAIETSDYEYENLRTRPDIYERLGHKSVQFANDFPFAATTVAYKLNLTGPAINISTACSSSLVAIHTACQSLLNFEADMMLAGGASYSVQQHLGYLYQKGGIGSFDGHCRAFDVEASGTVSGNGAGMLLLKRLVDAEADGDDIYAVILASAINNDGNQKVGYSAPGLQSQADVISEAQHIAEVSAEQISYVEAHGTGTPLGDPIEVAALTQAFRETSDGVNYCGLGALKSNIGHLACASGVVGMIKTVLSLKHQCIPPTLHINEPNPQLNLASSPFFLNTEERPWTPIDGRRIAGVSSFGMGGTNAHAVVEEYTAKPAAKAPSVSPLILPISAKSITSLRNNAVRLCKYLATNQKVDLSDLANTLWLGRDHYSYRAAFVVDSFIQGLKQLQVFSTSDAIKDIKPVTAGKSCVMVFPGQGNQFLGMGKSLYQHDSYFSAEFDKCQQHLLQHHDINLSDIVFNDNDGLINQTRYTQIALFVIEYALAKSLMQLGIRPAAMIGHSIGEYVAATLAGVFSLSDALDLVVTRGQLMQSMPAGQMASVHLSVKEIETLLPKGIGIAAINRQTQTVISGPESLMVPLLDDFEQQGIRVHRLVTSHAFHSAMMDDCLQDYESYLSKIKRKQPSIPFVSNLTGTWITNEQAVDTQYWVQHLRGSVRFFDGLCQLSEAFPESNFIEVGPGRSAKSVFAEHHQLASHIMVNVMTSARNPKSDHAIFTQGLAQLWTLGLPLSWSQYQLGSASQKDTEHSKYRRLHLPNYAYDRKKYWIQAELSNATRSVRSQITDSDDEVSSVGGDSGDLRKILFAPVWQQQPAGFKRLRRNANVAHPPHWVVLGDARDSLNELGKWVSNEAAITHIDWTQVSGRSDGENYTIDPDSYEDLVTAFKNIIESSSGAINIVFAAGLELTSAIESQHGAREIFYRLVNVARALSAIDPDLMLDRALRLVTVNTGLASISDQEHRNPISAMIAALTRCIQLEYPNLHCASVDVDLSDATWIKSLTGFVDDALPEPLVALRGRHQYLPSLVKVPDQSRSHDTTGLRNGGVYVITGGLTGIGYAIASHLAENYHAKLLLLGRSAGEFPPSLKLDWPRSASDHPSIESKLNRLADLGANVISLSVSVDNRSQLHRALSIAEQHHGKINGVIHAAGIAGGGLLATLSEDQCDKTFAAKVSGSHHLIDYFKNSLESDLDFILLCSSQNAIKGGVARADYSAANAYMDALAESAEYTFALPVLAVNWSAWKEVGMLHDFMISQGQELSADKAAESLSTAEGLRVFELLTELRLKRVVVAKKRLTLQRVVADTEVIEELARPVLSVRDRPLDMSCEYTAAATQISETLATIWSDTLGISPIGVDDDFFELGGNSLLSVQVALRIQHQFGHQYDVEAFLTRPTIRQFEDHILQQKTEVQDLSELERMLDSL